MLRLTEIYEQVIVEAKDPHEIYNEYYSDIPYDDFYKVIKADPRTKEKNGKLKKIGKYAKILLDLYRDDNLRFEDLDKAEHYLDIAYEKNVPLPKEEINNISDIYERVKQYVAQEDYDINTLLDMMNSDEYELIKNTENWYVFRPYTENAACKLGAGTEWCTAHGEYAVDKDKQDRSNAFEQYGDNLVIFINKNNNSEKYQYYYNPQAMEDPELIFTDVELMDKNDSMVNIQEFLVENKELEEVIIPMYEYIKDITKLNIYQARALLAFLKYYMPHYLQEIDVGGNELLKKLYLGSVGVEDIGDDIMQEHVNDTTIKDIQIENPDYVGSLPTFVKINIDGNNLSKKLEGGGKTIENFKIHNSVIEMSKEYLNYPLDSQKPFYYSIGDPVLNNINEFVDLLIEEALNHVGVSDNNEREEIKTNIKNNESFYKSLIDRVESRIIQFTNVAADKLVSKGIYDYDLYFDNGDITGMKIKYSCLLDSVRTNDIKELDLNTIVKIYQNCQENFPAISSYEELFEKREELRQNSEKNSYTNNEKLQGYALESTMEGLINKINEIMDNNQMEGEIKKIKRLIEHRQ